MELQKNDLVTVKIEDMSHDGEGVGKLEGFPLFVKDTVIGDVAEVKILKLKKNYGYARLTEWSRPARCPAGAEDASSRRCPMKNSWNLRGIRFRTIFHALAG